MPLMMLGPWGMRKVRAMVFGAPPAGMTPMQAEMGDFMRLIFTHFRPRTEQLPVFADAELARLTMPVLAIVGGRDVLLDSRDTKRRLARVLPHAGVRYLPEAYHYIPGQTSAIFEFLRGEASARAA